MEKTLSGRRRYNAGPTFQEVVADDPGVDLGHSTFKLPKVEEDTPTHDQGGRAPRSGGRVNGRSVGRPGEYRIGQIDEDDE